MGARKLFPSTAVLLIGLQALPVSGQPSVYRSDSNGYSLTIPDGWVRIPDDILRNTVKKMLKPDQALLYDAGFQPPTAPHWFAYPYVLVQIIRYADFGLDRQPSEEEAAKFVEKIANFDLRKGFRDAISDDFQNLMHSGEAGESFYDKTSHRFGFPLMLELKNVGKVRGLCAGYVGKGVIVQLLFYAKQDDWKRYQKTWTTLADSLTLDPEAAYDPSLNSIFGTGVGAGVVRGALAGCLGGLAVYLFRKKKTV